MLRAIVCAFVSMLAFSFVAGKLPAQTPSSTLTTWSVSIVLPPRLMAGHPGTLAVLGVDGKLAPGVTVILSSGQSVTTDRTGRAIFMAPSAGDYLLARGAGSTVAAFVEPAEQSSESQTVTVPPVVSVGDNFWLCGPGLRGNADQNNVSIDGRASIVLAASPECLVVLPDANTPPGSASILVDAPGVQWRTSTTLVSLDFDSPKPPLKPGEKSRLAVRAHGSRDMLELAVQNQTPGVMRFLHGDLQNVMTSGGETNIAQLDVQAVASGDFSFRARIAPEPESANAARYLRDAELLAPRELRRTIENMAQKLTQHPQNYRSVRSQLNQISSSTMTGDFKALIDAARASL
jgi:hypothetical protein